MPLSAFSLNPLVIRVGGFITQTIGIAAADLILIPGAARAVFVADGDAYLGIDRDALIPVVDTVHDNLFFLAGGSTRTLYLAGVTRVSAIAAATRLLNIQEVLIGE